MPRIGLIKFNFETKASVKLADPQSVSVSYTVKAKMSMVTKGANKLKKEQII